MIVVVDYRVVDVGRYPLSLFVSNCVVLNSRITQQKLCGSLQGTTGIARNLWSHRAVGGSPQKEGDAVTIGRGWIRGSTGAF